MTDPHSASRPTGPARWIVPGLLLLALLPVAYMIVRTSLAFRNAAYWDEIETVLYFLVKLKAAASGQDVLGLLFSFGNEHRTVTSRLLFAVSYWFTGTVNFTVIGILGNLCLLGVCGILLATAGTVVRRVQLAVVLGCLFFQLQHFENFFWSGSSIDHFQVVTLATAALAALAGRSPTSLALACTAAALATFTLAHGMLVWPIGALALVADRRWVHLKAWGIVAFVVLGCFFTGFNFNTGHTIGDLSFAGLGRLVRFWLALLGAPLALGYVPLAPFLGAALLGLLATQLRPATVARERVVLPLALWAIAALLLIAFGRVDVVGGHVHSRYYVLSCLAWGLVIFLLLNERPDPDRPYRTLLRATPLLVFFNLAADLTSAHDARSWIICRDSALENFIRRGRDGTGPFHLHPIPAYTDLVVQKVEKAGIYFMPRTCLPRRLGPAREVGDILYFIDRIPLTETLVAIEGWTGLRGVPSQAGQIAVILQSERSRLVFTTLPMERKDVQAAHPTEQWRQSGFRFEIRRWLLPAENFQIGLLLQSPRGTEYIMTAHRLDLTGAGRGVLATGQ